MNPPRQVLKGTHTFAVRDRYTLHDVVGQGAQGIICAAEDKEAPAGANTVAIKKIPNVFDDAMASKRLLREVQLLRHFQHENILRLKVRPPCFASPQGNVARAHQPRSSTRLDRPADPCARPRTCPACVARAGF
jgi:hypothetical protein